MRYQEEIVSDEFIDEVWDILEENKEEIVPYHVPLDPDKLMYIMAAKSGQYVLYSARTDEGVIKGYVGFFLVTHPHYALDTAQQDILFVSRDSRKGMVGIKLLKFSEVELKKRGVQLILQHSHASKDLSPIFKRLGYEPCERVFAKEI